MRLRYLVLVLAFILPAALPAAPKPTHPPEAAVASAHPLASKAGMEILREGGNAFDAAVAVSAALGVVEPYSSGIGGGGFWLLHQVDGHDVMVDGREYAPGAATADMYLDADGNPQLRASKDGPRAAAIPGEPAALAWIASHYGKLPLAKSLAPAIRLARDGFPADKRLIEAIRAKESLLKRWPAAGKVFLDHGEVPTEGWIVHRPDLARTLEILAKQGRDGFYRGPLARKLVAGVRAAGGIWTREDLADYRVVERTPLEGQYKDIHIVSAPPPSSGGVGLIDMLHILNGYDLDSLDAVTRDHLIIEAMRRAYRDRADYLGDPAFVKMPIAMLTSPFYAAGQRTSIRLDRATRSDELAPVLPSQEGHHTTHFSILDRDGNRVATTKTINFWFGSGFMVPGTGVLLNNEMDDFSMKPGVPNGFGLIGNQANAIAPHKRPLSSMTPTFLDSPRGIAILGTPGGSRIISMVLLGTLTWADGGDARAIVSRPRFHHQYIPDEVQYEPGCFSDKEIAGLKALGHHLKALTRHYGNMQAVTWDYGSGEVKAASDPRGIGAPNIY
ncbi:MAG: gamma-glutamyltransferase [Gammaproteobacteria bacterium]|jgi:gamma-glutamyltranspeptidase/glutathione hydrolase